MDTIQIRLTPKLVDKVDKLVDTGIYANRSDAIRDAVRRLVGIIPDSGDSVKEVKELRKRLSKEKFNLNEINKLAD